MEAEKEIVNRVANSGIVTLDLENFYQEGERVIVDIKDQLFQELILKEKDFRAYIKATDWTKFKNKFVAITCSADAIIPNWAYMLLTSVLQPHARKIVFGTAVDLETKIFLDQFSTHDWNQYAEAKVVIKGCSKVEVPAAVYVEATRLLMPFASSIMFGEPCSTVPVFKKAKA
jgi:NDP-sugar pyrophosphorylase family protein